MSPRIRNGIPHIDAFDLEPGRNIAGSYVVEEKLGQGWEGEVYKVSEQRTGVFRAAKIFYPQRNVGDRAVRLYAKKLDTLRHCGLVIQYHHSESFRFRRVPVSCLLSEFVEGELLSRFVERQPGRRMHPFEALHLLYQLAKGMEEIHAVGPYHGDLHAENVFVRRHGIYFEVKVIDFFHYGPSTPAHRRDDVVDLAHLLYAATGGRKHYAKQPPEVKAICKGLRRDLILKHYPTARAMRRHLETFTWS